MEVNFWEFPLCPLNPIFNYLRGKLLLPNFYFSLNMVVNKSAKVVTSKYVTTGCVFGQVEMNSVSSSSTCNGGFELFNRCYSLEIVNKLAILLLHLVQLVKHRFFKIWVTWCQDVSDAVFTIADVVALLWIQEVGQPELLLLVDQMAVFEFWSGLLVEEISEEQIGPGVMKVNFVHNPRWLHGEGILRRWEASEDGDQMIQASDIY